MGEVEKVANEQSNGGEEGAGARGEEAREAAAADSSAGVRVVYTGAQLAAWGERYGTGVRQVRRWLNVGREAGDPTPFDEPAKMPSWWERMRGIGKLSHRCPEKILAAARRAEAAEGLRNAECGMRNGEQTETTPVSSGVGVLSDERPDLEEGEEVRIARQQVAVAAEELEVARLKMRALPEEPRWKDNYSYWSRQLQAAMKTFKEHKSEDREAQKARGNLISKAEVMNDAYELVKMLAKMRASLVKTVRTELKMARVDMPDDLLELVGATIERVAVGQEEIFRNLGSAKEGDDGSLILAR
jgi:hypothetical protein